MADPHDVSATKALRREFSKRGVDTSLADLRVSHGVAYVRGQLRMLRGVDGSIEVTVGNITHALRARAEFRDVVIDAVLRN